EQIRREYENEHKPQRLSLEELEGFASQLLQNGLVENDSPAPGRLLHDRIEKQEAMRPWRQFASVLSFKIPLLHSGRWVDRFIPFGRVVFHPLAVLTTLFFLLSGIGVIVRRWDDFCEQVPRWQELFTLRSVVYLWLAVGLVKIFHELAHALCTRVL